MVSAGFAAGALGSAGCEGELLAGEVVLGAAVLAVDALVLGVFGLPEEGGDVEAVSLAGADFVVDVLAGVVFAAGVLVAAVLAESLLVVLDEAARRFEPEVLADPFAGAAEEPRVEVVFLPEAVEGEAVSASSGAGLAGLVTDSAVACLPEGVREEPPLPRRSAAARAMAPAMS